ncbi:MAG: outer membrane beta-barrel family protein, partial [Taibaiella sp.]|nr:outer membrane beta-barrel family protein [Taibaiella sp.]
IRHQYINQLPSAMVNRKLDAKSSLSFSFTRRIQRPSAEELNPFINRSNPNFESNGNPYLQPITSNVFQLSYLLSAKVTFNISLSGMFFNNVFSPFPFYDAASDITITRVENYGKGRVLKANIYFGYPVNTRWNFSMNSDIRHVKLNGFANGNPVKNSGVDVYVYASSGHNFSNNWKASADVMFKKGGLLLPIGRTNGFVASSFSINKNFMSSKLTVSAAVNNPFSKYRVVNEKVIGPDFLQTSVNTVYFRRFTVSINYHFGMLKTEIKKSKKTIENDDMVK